MAAMVNQYEQELKKQFINILNLLQPEITTLSDSQPFVRLHGAGESVSLYRILRKPFSFSGTATFHCHMITYSLCLLARKFAFILIMLLTRSKVSFTLRNRKQTKNPFEKKRNVKKRLMRPSKNNKKIELHLLGRCSKVRLEFRSKMVWPKQQQWK